LITEVESPQRKTGHDQSLDAIDEKKERCYIYVADELGFIKVWNL